MTWTVDQPWGIPSPIVVIAYPYAPGTICPLTREEEEITGNEPEVMRYCEANEMERAKEVRDCYTGWYDFVGVYVYDEEQKDYALKV